MMLLMNPLAMSSLESMFHCALLTCLEAEAEILVHTAEMHNFMCNDSWDNSHGILMEHVLLTI